MAKTQIRVDGAAKVTVTRIETIPDLFGTVAKFSRLVKADVAGSLLNLSSRAGELARIGGLDDGNYEEQQMAVANMLVSTIVAATVLGVSEPALIGAIRESIELQASEAVKAQMTALLADAGLSHVEPANDAEQREAA